MYSKFFMESYKYLDNSDKNLQKFLKTLWILKVYWKICRSFSKSLVKSSKNFRNPWKTLWILKIYSKIFIDFFKFLDKCSKTLEILGKPSDFSKCIKKSFCNPPNFSTNFRKLQKSLRILLNCQSLFKNLHKKSQISQKIIRNPWEALLILRNSSKFLEKSSEIF